MFASWTKYSGISLLMALIALSACAPARQPVPIGTIPSPRAVTVQDEQYGHEILQQLSQRWKLDYNDNRLQNLISIVDRLSTAAKANAQPWHVYLFKDANFKNAAATRGNHVFVWSGLLDKTKNEPELATVIGHEMAHVIAHHTDPDPNEELRKMLINVGALAAGIAVSHAASPSIAQTAGNLTSSLTSEIGSGILVYPYSRSMELEADHIGLMLMAEAKYNPEAALSFWSRAENDPDFSRGLQFLSSHPPAAERLGNLRKIMPLALARYRGERLQGANELASGPTRPDSFDLGRGSIQRPERFPDRRWKVRAERAVVYAAPVLTSQTLGEFAHGAPIEGTPVNGWIEIYTPDHGFVRSEDLTAENR